MKLRGACGQVSQYPRFCKSFSPTYYSSSLCYSPALFQQSTLYWQLICYKSGQFHSLAHTTYQHEIQLHLHPSEQFCRAFKIRCVLHLQLSCKKPKIQANKLPPAFHPEYKAITAKPAVCISKHSNVINFGLSSFQFWGLCKNKTKQNSAGFLLTSKLLNWPKIVFYPLQKRNSGDSSAGMIQDKGHFTAVPVRIFWEREMFLIPSGSFNKI